MKKKGFTIIELLTVITIIVLLIGLAVPGIRKAKRVAMDLTQKAGFRDIGIGLEMWYMDNGEYPDSARAFGTSGLHTTGAHHLAEAMLGRDGHGFDAKSSWDAEFDETVVPLPYTSTTPYGDRENTYIDAEKNDSFQLAQIYDNAVVSWSAYPGDVDEFAVATSGTARQAGVLTDVFKRKRITTVSGDSAKVGSPILYFRAKQSDKFSPFNPAQSVFNYNDNIDILALGHNKTQEEHPFYDSTATTVSRWTGAVRGQGIDDFYESLVNTRVRPIGMNAPVPYNKHTFVLISAGADGLYGTKDDITNTP